MDCSNLEVSYYWWCGESGSDPGIPSGKPWKQELDHPSLVMMQEAAMLLVRAISQPANFGSLGE